MVVSRTFTSFFRRYARGSRWLTCFHAYISARIVARQEAATSRWNAFHFYASTGRCFMTIRARRALISRPDITSLESLNQARICTCDCGQGCSLSTLCYFLEAFSVYPRILLAQIQRRQGRCLVVCWLCPNSSCCQVVALSSARIAAELFLWIPSRTKK